MRITQTVSQFALLWHEMRSPKVLAAAVAQPRTIIPRNGMHHCGFPTTFHSLYARNCAVQSRGPAHRQRLASWPSAACSGTASASDPSSRLGRQPYGDHACTTELSLYFRRALMSRKICHDVCVLLGRWHCSRADIG